MNGHVSGMTRRNESGTLGRRDGGVTLSALRTFVAVGETLSISAAARVLGVSQPNVSIQLASLEQACGVLLVHRRPQLALTEAGRDLFMRARLVVSRVGEFEASARDLREMQRGHLAVGLSTPHLAMPLIADFARLYPQISLRMGLGNTAQLLDELSRCRIDVGIMTLSEPPAQFTAILIAAPKLAICLRRDDTLAQRSVLTPQDLADRSLILREEGSMTRSALEAAFAAVAVPLVSGYVLGSREAMKEAVAAGLGIGALFVDELGHDSRLRAIPLQVRAQSTGVYAVILKESLALPAVKAFISHSSAATCSTDQAR